MFGQWAVGGFHAALDDHLVQFSMDTMVKDVVYRFERHVHCGLNRPYELRRAEHSPDRIPTGSIQSLRFLKTSNLGISKLA